MEMKISVFILLSMMIAGKVSVKLKTTVKDSMLDKMLKAIT